MCDDRHRGHGETGVGAGGAHARQHGRGGGHDDGGQQEHGQSHRGAGKTDGEGGGAS